MSVVVDADVVIGALDAGDRHHARARSLFEEWEKDGTTCVISSVNLAEVLVAPARNEHDLRVARAAIAALGLTVKAASAAMSTDAARFRARHPISLADGFCLATSRRLDGVVASFDRRVLRAARAERVPVLRR